MKRVTIDIDEKYADAISITVFGMSQNGMSNMQANASVFASVFMTDLSGGINHIMIDSEGKAKADIK